MDLLSRDEFYYLSTYLDYLALGRLVQSNSQINKIYQSEKFEEFIKNKRIAYVRKKYGKAEWMMMSFVRKNNLPGLEHLKKHGWDYGLRFNMNNNAAIKAAAFSSSPTVIRFLLSDPDVSPGATNNTPLLNAIQRGVGGNEIVKIFLEEAKVDPALPNNEPLLNAIKNSNVELVRMLIEFSVNINDHNPIPTEAWQYEAKPLTVACTYGNTEIVQLLLKDGRIDPSEFDNQALINASVGGFAEIVEILLKYSQVNPSAQKNKALNEACRQRSIKVVNLLVSDPRTQPSYEAILESIRRKDDDIFLILMNGMKIDPSYQDNILILEASKSGCVGAVEYLLKHAIVDPATENNYPIIEASGRGNYMTVELLLNDFRVNPFDQNSLAISKALKNRYTDIVTMLLRSPRVSESIYVQGLSDQEPYTIERILRQEQLIDDINEALTEADHAKINQLMAGELSVHTVIEVCKYIKSSLGTISPDVLYSNPKFYRLMPNYS